MTAFPVHQVHPVDPVDPVDLLDNSKNFIFSVKYYAVGTISGKLDSQNAQTRSPWLAMGSYLARMELQFPLSFLYGSQASERQYLSLT